jgi:DNA gyrase subunit A
MPKTSKNTLGVQVMSLKKNKVVTSVREAAESGIKNASRYRVKTVPAAGALLREEDSGNEQLTLE